MNIEYNDRFDRELIDYLMGFFSRNAVEILNTTSDVVQESLYQIRFEGKEIVLQFFYEQEDSDCEAQIRITSILLQGTLKRTGLSKSLINELLAYCKRHNDMSLWIYDLINQSWCAYLIQHGAILIQPESLDAQPPAII